MGIYERLGVRTIINAAGTQTRLGGTLMLPEAVAAMAEATAALVPIEELQAAASRAIAQACGSEAGYVTSGASAGLTLATAACMAGLDIAKMSALPLAWEAGGIKDEVVISRPHRNSYDHAFRAAGAMLVEVGMSDRYLGVGVRETELWEIEAAIGERTAAIAYTAGRHPHPPLADVARLGQRYGVPVIVDAAGQLPPPANLRRYTGEGADLVSYSGGKAMQGPQGTGILAGRKDLIASVALQQLDMDVTFELWSPPAELIPKQRLAGLPRHGVGRGYKVGREQIAGLLAALEVFTEERMAGEYERWVDLLEGLSAGLAGAPGLETGLVRPVEPGGFPLLEVRLDEEALGLSASVVIQRLQDGTPPVHVGERRILEGILVVHPVNLDEGTAAEVARRLRSAVEM